jgi:ipoprotein LpqH
MKRVLAAALGVIASATVLTACSDGSGSTDTSQAATGGNTEVKVDGGDLAGLDLDSVSCVKQAGKINIGSGSIGGQQGLGVVMTDEATPKVESLGLVVDGSALAVSNMAGASVGSAEVKVDGDTYTITGEAAGADMKNPMAGMISKPFTITVTCG